MSTLDGIVKALGQRFDEETLHTALLLAFVQAAYGTVRTIAAPSPLYRLSYDDESHQIAFEESGGKSHVPRPHGMDMSDLDLLLISNLRDIPVLLEGETGVGKTFISQAYLRTILPKESYVSLRLSGSTFLNNVFQPFLEGRIEQGMPVTRIKQQAVDTIGALFIDEINRGDPQSILQLLDNEIFNAGVFTKLGLPIPRLDGGSETASERRKKLLIVSAQNPASTVEAKFTGTVELDAAVDNRLLKIIFGNAARSVGSTLWLTEDIAKPFESFQAEFGTLAAGHLGVERDLFAGLGTDWLSVYAYVTDSRWTDKPVLYSALELMDLYTGVMGGELPEKYAYERGVIEDWCRALEVDVPIRETVQVTEKVAKIHEIVSSFKVPVIFRDIVQVKKLADVLATLANVREALVCKDPVRIYLGLDKFVSIREVASAMALLLVSKQVPGSPPPTPLVNEVVVQYTTLVKKYIDDMGYPSARFDRKDANLGLKKLAIAKAARETLKKKESAGFLSGRIVEEAKRITRYASATQEIASVLVCKTVADLLTLAGFVAHHQDALESEILAAKETRNDADLVKGIARFYMDRRKSLAAVIPDIFQHRIQRTLGV